MAILLIFIAKPWWFDFRIKVKFYMLRIFHWQIASVLCDATVEGHFGFQLALFPVPAHLPACAGARRKQNPERACRGKRKTPPVSGLFWGFPQSFNLRVVIFLLLGSGCVRRLTFKIVLMLIKSQALHRSVNCILLQWLVMVLHVRGDHTGLPLV